MAERPTLAMQENLLTLLCYDDEAGKIVFNMVEAPLFEGDYRLVAERAIEYWRDHNQAPKQHTPDLLAEEIEDKHNRRANSYRRILSALIDWSSQVNKQYVLTELRKFSYTQRMKQTIIKSAERINAKQELAIEEVETMWHDFFRAKEIQFDRGTRLYDIGKLVDLLAERQKEFVSGIYEFDAGGIIPERGALFLFLGATGKGKSWFMVNCGKANLMRRKKVLHVTLEMSETHVQQRYFQNLFSVPKRYAEQVSTLRFIFNRERKIVGFDTADFEPDFTFDSPALVLELEEHVKALAGRTENLIIKGFPMRSLTIPQLEAYLDSLEMTEKFIPDLLIVDSPYLMKTDPKNYRISMGRTMEDMRGLLAARNIAGIGGHQISRTGAEAAIARGIHVAEDWSVIQTCDTIAILSVTEAEEQMGLARIFVDKARNEKGKFGVMITQNYDIGQFAIQSHRMVGDYWDLVKVYSGDEKADQINDDEEEDEE